MNKFFATVALAALALTSCIKENDSYKDLIPVQPGLSIYQFTMNQNTVAMEPANMGVRLAILLAEAAKQNPDKDLADVKLSEVKSDKVYVQQALFRSQTKIELQDDGNYKITFDKNVPMLDGLYLGGSMLVITNGAKLLSETQYSTPWRIQLDEVKVMANTTSGDAMTIHLESGETVLYSNQDDTYTIQLIGMRANIDKSTFSSDWGGVFTFSAEDPSLAYSLCAGKYFNVEGQASGPTIYTYDNTQSLGMSYELTDGIFNGQQIVNGTQECSFTSYLEYDTAAYPSPKMQYVWTLDKETGKYSFKVYYNNYVYPKD